MVVAVVTVQVVGDSAVLVSDHQLIYYANEAGVTFPYEPTSLQPPITQAISYYLPTQLKLPKYV
jgi:hypothetical protein